MSDAAADDATNALPISVKVKVDRKELEEWKKRAKWVLRGFVHESLYMVGIKREPFNEPFKPETKDASDPVTWGRTIAAVKRAGKWHIGAIPRNAKPAPYGWSQGCRIIGSGMTDIIGGIYLGGFAREAIVVDGEDNGELKKAYSAFVQNLHAFEKLTTDEILTLLMAHVKSLLHHDEKGVNHLLHAHGIRKPDQKIGLSAFLRGGVGVCRHQALLAGYLIQRLLSESDQRYRLRGSFSIERNRIPIFGAHAWVVYTDEAGKRFVVDAAQDVAGPMEKVMKAAWVWPYDRNAKKKQV